MAQAVNERLRAARIAAGYKSASAAARAHGWNEATYRHHENGTRNFGRDHSAAYANAFKASSWWLSGIVDYNVPDDQDLKPRASPSEFFGHESAEATLHIKLGLAFVGVYSLEAIAREKEFGDISPTIPRSPPQSLVTHDITELQQLANVTYDLIVAVRVGTSDMSPTIQRGALVLVDLGHTDIDSHDGLWLYSQGEIATIRRFRPIEKFKVSIHADSQSIEPYQAVIGHLTVHGKVVWIGQRA